MIRARRNFQTVSQKFNVLWCTNQWSMLLNFFGGNLYFSKIKNWFVLMFLMINLYKNVKGLKIFSCKRML